MMTDVLSYIKDRYDKDIDSVDELFANKDKRPLPEDVSAYLKYKKETGTRHRRLFTITKRL